MFLVFEAINEVKEQKTKIFIKYQKIPVSNIIAINQTKEQGTNVLSRHRNLLFLFKSKKRSKRTRKRVLIKSRKLVVLVFEAINKAR